MTPGSVEVMVMPAPTDEADTRHVPDALIAATALAAVAVSDAPTTNEPVKGVAEGTVTALCPANVTAAPIAMARPFKLAVVPKEIAVLARIVPANVDEEPKVAELPTIQ